MEDSGPATGQPRHFFAASEARRLVDHDNFWRWVGTLFRWRRFIVLFTAVVAVLAIVISLILPVWYKSTTRLLTPEGSSGGGLVSLLGDFAPEAGSLLGVGRGGDTNRYFSILTSRSMMQRVVEQFNLVAVYELAESETPVDDAMELLRGNSNFVLDQEFEFIAVEVYDRDPQRAADMANFFVAELNRINSNLSANNASLYAAYIQENLHDAQTALDSARARMQRFQERYGVIDLPTQTQTFLENLAQLRRDVLEAEIQHEVLSNQLGPDNQRTRASGVLAAASRSKYQAALAGAERLLPVPQSDIPSVANQYAQLLQDVLIQAEIVKFIRPLYEQARFDVQREKVAVQVLDPAVPASRKAKPVRSVIVILATMSGFLIAVMFVLVFDWISREHKVIASRLQQGVDSGTRAEGV
ncbi:MAG: Wzz/FepE/Etk N-terminal domain-containing protein [Rhodothermales bacterium]|nr:Wzz/FepE/Etk N-terminal domain-containing protein [Rhodothermales bacterium]